MTDQTPQEPTAAEQHQEDLARVQAQLGVTEATRVVSKVFSGIFGSSRGPGPHSRTSFENHELNAMVDLVEHSNPADLEEAGRALWQARDALKSASRELKHHVGEVQWKGTAGDEFRSFGEALVRHADNLAAFADVAGTQITVAGTGLASVQKSMPARDTRLNKQNVSEIALPKRVEGNPEYAAALKAEKNRQEAINQMNRLASFYAVSEERLAGQEAPRFDRALNAKVPQPRGQVRPPRQSPYAGMTGETSPRSAPTSAPGPQEFGGTGNAPQHQTAGTIPPAHAPDTSMQIDHVAAPAAPPVTPGGTPAPPVTGAPGPQTMPPPPVMNRVPPVQPAQQSGTRGAGRPAPPSAPGASGKGAVGAAVPPAVARPGAAGGAPVAAGRAGVAGPVAPGAPGQQPAAGRAGAGMPGPVGGGGQGPMAGRAGGTGPMGPMGQAPMAGRAGAAGQPIAGRAGNGPTSAARAGRPDGIVGGTPQRAASSSSSGPQIPRGTVVGGEDTAQGRPATGRLGQFGVVGANPVNGTLNSGGRGIPGVNGVVGASSGNASPLRSRTGEFTQGGAGLVRGPARRPQSDDEEQNASARPDYLTEDQETWAVQRRGTVPPVVE